MRLPPLYYIRHGETDWNKQGLIQGWIDTDLNELGRAQARDLAQALISRQSELNDFDFFVSPQRRAQDTMRAIAEAQGRDFSTITSDARLRELGFGIWEGRPFWELKASPIYPADPEGRYTFRPDGGESYEDGVARVTSFLSELKGPALIVAHGAVGRCLMGYVTGLPGDSIVDLATPQGCYCKLENGTASWFDASHSRL